MKRRTESDSPRKNNKHVFTDDAQPAHSTLSEYRAATAPDAIRYRRVASHYRVCRRMDLWRNGGTTFYRFCRMGRRFALPCAAVPTHLSASDEQIISKHGVLSRKTDYMEQYRIVDFVEHQSFMQQLCGLKTVHIFSMDRNTPQLDLVGIRRNLDVVTLIRERVEYNKRKKGIYEITNH